MEELAREAKRHMDDFYGSSTPKDIHQYTAKVLLLNSIMCIVELYSEITSIAS